MIWWFAGRKKAVFYVLLCVSLWALIPVVAKLGQHGLDHYQFLFWSSVVSFFALGIGTFLFGASKSFLDFSIREWLYYGFLGLLGTYLYYLCLYFGYSHGQGIEILAIQYTWPIMVVLLSMILLDEKINVRKFTAITIGFVGVLLVLSKGKIAGFEVEKIGVMAMVGVGAFCFALFSVLSTKTTDDLMAVTTIYFLVATLASGISMICFSEFKLPSSDNVVAVLLNGIFINGFSYVFWIKALKSASLAFIAPFAFLTPILSVFYLVWFFQEPVLIIYGVGLLLIVLGGFISSFGGVETK